MQRKRSGRKYFKYILLFFCLILLILAGAFFVKNITLKYLTIDIEDENCINKNQVEQSVNISNKNYLFASFEKEKQKIERDFICIKSVAFQKTFPDKILAKITTRKPSLIFLADSSSSSSSAEILDQIINPATDSARITFKFEDVFLLDNEGVIFSKNNIDGIRKINFLGNKLRLGERVDIRAVEGILKVLSNANDLGMNVWDSYLDDGNFYIKTDSGMVVFDLKSKLNTQIASLQLILQKAKIDNENIEFIDLRFDKPVVRYGKK